jgi:tetratricopeptide (TPR) repeat protein
MDLRLLDSLDLPARRSPDESLKDIAVEPLMLQDFTALSESLPWKLSELSWQIEGVRQFGSNRVPFIINNDGRCSQAAARLLFANLQDAAPEEPFEILELGGGCGLFARYFVKAFTELCETERRDWSNRLVYIVTDASRRTVEHWCELGVFQEFGPRVRVGTCNAMRPDSAVDLNGAPLLGNSLRCVIANYTLDVLPSSVLRKKGNELEELVIRSNLTKSQELWHSYTGLRIDQVRACVRTNDPKAQVLLLSLMSLLEFEAAFRPVKNDKLPDLEHALSRANGEPVIANHGAFEAIERWLELLVPSGFFLMNDYGSAAGDNVSAAAIPQQFGDTLACGINFPLLKERFERTGIHVAAPAGDDDRAIHSRIFFTGSLDNTVDAFSTLYSHAADLWFEQRSQEAARLAASGRNSEALDTFREALSRAPRNWQLIGRAAEFVGLRLQEHKAGLELARSALELNPWFSPWLWNVLGDCLFALGQNDSAHEAYQEALKADPKDVRAHFNLSFTHLARGEPDQALLAIAKAFAMDVTGLYRDRLLAKQAQIIDAISTKWLGEQQRLAAQHSTLQAAAAASAVEATRLACT